MSVISQPIPGRETGAGSRNIEIIKLFKIDIHYFLCKDASFMKACQQALGAERKKVFSILTMSLLTGWFHGGDWFSLHNVFNSCTSISAIYTRNVRRWNWP